MLHGLSVYRDVRMPRSRGEVTESKSIVYIARDNDVCLYSSLQSRHRLLLRVCLVNVLRRRLPTGILTFATEEMADELK